jgi:hypothetical protein
MDAFHDTKPPLGEPRPAGVPATPVGRPFPEARTCR